MRPRTLKSAAEAGDIDAMEYHLARGADINARTAAGHFPLGGAIFYSHSEAVEFLIAEGAKINMKTEFDWTPLYMPAWRGNARIAALLIAAGAHLNSRTIGGWNSPSGFTPLHAAADNGSLEVVKLLIAAGASLIARNGSGKTALDVAVERGNNQIARFLRAALKKASRNARPQRTRDASKMQIPIRSTTTEVARTNRQKPPR